MGRILIKDIYLNGSRADILIEGNRISKIAENIDNIYPNSTVIDGKGKAVIPGFANMHTHAAMTMMRGSKEDEKLHKWLAGIWEMETRLDDELVYWGTRLACVEMIKTGTTFYNDQYFRIGEAVKATSEMGLRGAHSFVFLDLGDKEKIFLQREQCQAAYEESRKWGSTSIFEIGVHSIYTVSEENIMWACEFARKHNLKVHIHIAETAQELEESIERHSCTPVQYLENLGIFSEDIIAAHCIWLDGNDIATLGRHRVNVVHNINSNLKLASGYKFKFQELEDAGANICLGTDGVASNNNLDMMETMKITALVQKAWRKDPSAVRLPQLISSATLNGYKAFGLDGGIVREGALADLSIIDISNYAFTPNINFDANLVYSAHSDCVSSVICDGRIVMENRQIAAEEEILSNVRRLYGRILGQTI
ncbi:MAG: amidohydrolase [Bacteroidales bacterium]|nr:amidohydrolase [Bacteroidales bacterium]